MTPPTCQFDNTPLTEATWTQPIPNAPCPAGTYNYYYCPKCGFRYSPHELGMPATAIPLKEVSHDTTASPVR